MQAEAQSAIVPPSSGAAALWTGRVLTALAALFLLFDATIKLLNLDVVKQSMQQLGYPDVAVGIGLIELVCTTLYLVPRTAVLGAVLLMAILGGGIASHLRVGDPLFTHLLFGVYLGLVVWGGLWLRDPQLRAIFPIKR
jgi:DoxX-like family